MTIKDSFGNRKKSTKKNNTKQNDVNKHPQYIN